MTNALHIQDKDSEQIRFGAISIDTNIFDKAQLFLDRGILRQMIQFKDTGVKFILPDVVQREVFRHILAEAQSAEQVLRKSLKSMGKHWQVTDGDIEDTISKLLSGDGASETAKQRLDAYIHDTGCNVIPTSQFVNVGRLLDLYFNTEAPFESKEKKKNEFPDALALITLSEWATANKTKILVVSNDGGWKKFCETDENLECTHDLKSALKKFHEDSKFVCALLSKGFSSSSEAEGKLGSLLYDAIEDALSSFNYELDGASDFVFDYEVIEVNMIGYELLPSGDASVFTPIDAGEEHLVMAATANIRASVTGSFTFYVIDSIDKDEINIGSNEFTKEIEVQTDIIIELSGEDILHNHEVDYIEISPKNVYADFGYISPDFGKPENHYD